MFRFFDNLVDPFVPYDEDKATPPGLFAFVYAMMRPFGGVLIVAALLTICGAAVEVGLIWYAGRLIDIMAESGPAAFLANHGLEVALVAGAVLILRPLLVLFDLGTLNLGLMPNIGTLARWRGHRKVLRQSVGWFEQDFAGRIANRVMQTAPSLGEAAYQVFDALIYASFYLVAALIMLAEVELALAIPLLIWFASYVAMMAWFTPRVGAASKAFSDARSAINGRIVDAYTNIQTVKLFSHAGREEAFAKEAIARGRTTFARQMRVITMMGVELETLNSALTVGVVGWAVWLWLDGAASLGAVAAASALVLRLSGMSGWIMWAISSLFQNLGVIAEGMETIADPVRLNDAPGAPALKVTKGEIRFEDVEHRYGRDKGGLEGLSLTIAPGERVGVVGRSGAGKSTLVNLLLRFHDVEGGRILIDGQNVAEVRQESLRRHIGMVTQDTSLLHRSVRDNILYGRPDATEAEVAAATRRVKADAFIPDLRDPEGRAGLDAHVGERGVKLSGGQRQRIALARVVLKDAPILVLDEATSALDSEVEAAIQSSLEELMQGKTVIAIAHRLSTIARMDRIVVIDQGRVIEEGPHQALLDRGGVYAMLWSRQSDGFPGVEAAE